MSVFDIQPVPTLSAIRDGSYAPDKDAMRTAIEGHLEGMSAVDVIDTLRHEDVEHRFVSEDLVSVIPRKTFLPLLASYVCVIDLAFEAGAFKAVQDISGCGLIAP